MDDSANLAPPFQPPDIWRSTSKPNDAAGCHAGVPRQWSMEVSCRPIQKPVRERGTWFSLMISPIRRNER